MLAFDTNLLFYAVNRSSPFHEAALAFLESIREDPKVAVCEFALLELYCLLRSPKVNAKPLRPEGAVEVIEAYRNHLGSPRSPSGGSKPTCFGWCSPGGSRVF